MLSVDMSSLWGDDTKQIVKGIKEATDHIKSYYNATNTTKDMLLALGEDIEEICDFWTGNTYVGHPKNKKVKKAFQSFFESLMELLLKMKDSKKAFEKRVANSILYRGTVYRYLGSTDSVKKAIAPKYNKIYVSWSKNPENSYLESKLCGTMTWMSCNISAPYYGIDLEAIGSSRGNEAEVVFPTIKKCITEIKYISEEDDD